MEGKKEKKRSSFHDQRVIGYEDRIRAFSTPDKIFRYFATINIRDRSGNSLIYMSPDDFFRSITPGIIQPDGLGLDQFRSMSIEVKMMSLCSHKYNETHTYTVT